MLHAVARQKARAAFSSSVRIEIVIGVLLLAVCNLTELRLGRIQCVYHAGTSMGWLKGCTTGFSRPLVLRSCNTMLRSKIPASAPSEVGENPVR